MKGVLQLDLDENELFFFDEGKIRCCLEGCSWSCSCKEKKPLEKFGEHIQGEHIGV